jgi:hypothetical protein
LPFTKQALNALLAMTQQAFFAPLSHRNSEKTFNFHNISHPGRLASLRMVFARFFWRGLATNIHAWS